MEKRITLDEAVSKVQNGMTLMIGGFLGCGTPEKVIDGLVEKGVKDLTIICNDTSFIDRGLGKLVANKQVKEVITSHIGTNKETGSQMHAGTLEVVLVPQGSLAERVRAGGAGLGGVLTPIGLGTPIEADKRKIEVDGKTFLLETALRADVALIHGSIVDKKGNVFYNQATQNFNPLMATAADTVIVQAEKIVDVGALDPHKVVTPGLFIDYIVGEA